MKTVQLMSNFVFLVVIVSTGKSYKKLIGEPSGVKGEGGGGRVNSTRKNASQSPNCFKFPGT